MLVAEGDAVNATVIDVGVTTVTAGVGAFNVTSDAVVALVPVLSLEVWKVVPFPSAIIFTTYEVATVSPEIAVPESYGEMVRNSVVPSLE